MVKYYGPEFGNPASIHAEGLAASRVLAAARLQCATTLHAHADEIVFTGSGTESNNVAIFGVVDALLAGKGKNAHELHVITSVIEHPSVLECFRILEERGVAVDYISVDERGLVNLKELKEKIRPNTCLVSIMYVNNEIGTIQPIAEIAKMIRREKKERGLRNAPGEKKQRIENTPLLFHTDASQAVLYCEMSVEKLGVDLLTIDGHKVYGPKGVGALFVRRDTKIKAVTVGGGQENGLRSGTPNIPAIAGLAKALQIADEERASETLRLTELRDYFISQIRAQFSEKFPNLQFNGDVQERIANNVNVSFPGIDNEFLVLQLDAKGIACSTKSSCLRDEDESYVIAALNQNAASIPHSTTAHLSQNALRFSLGRFTTKKQIDITIKTLSRILNK